VDVDDEMISSLNTRRAMDFELEDYWDAGEYLDGRDRFPLCVTLNIVKFNMLMVLPFIDSRLRYLQLTS